MRTFCTVLTVAIVFLVVSSGTNKDRRRGDNSEHHRKDGDHRRDSAEDEEEEEEGFRQGYACESSKLTITCNPRRWIRIISAAYGRMNSDICPEHGSQLPPSPCMSTKSLEVVKRLCERRGHNCIIPVQSRTFGEDPCPGVSKYLNVQYACERDKQPTEPSTVFPLPPPTTGRLADSCPAVSRRHILWPATPAGTVATMVCPTPSIGGLASWSCGHSPARWLRAPDLSKCVSQRVTILSPEPPPSAGPSGVKGYLLTVADEMESISNQQGALYGGDIQQLLNVMNGYVQKVGMVIDRGQIPELKTFVHRSTQAVLNTGSNLLTEQQSESWADLPAVAKSLAATKLLRSVDETAYQITRNLDESLVISNLSNIVVEMNIVNKTSKQYGQQLTFPTKRLLLGSVWESATDVITLTSETVRRLTVSSRADFVFSLYNNLEQYLSPTSNTSALDPMSSADNGTVVADIVNTRIVSLNVNSSSASGLKTNLFEPVTITLAHIQTENVSNPQCMYLKMTSDNVGGVWSSDGCWLVETNATHTTCACNHLTHFAVIMSPTAPELSPAHYFALTFITYFGCTISCICLLLAFITFRFFRSLQCDRNTIHTNLVACLFIANIIFLVGIAQYNFRILCAVIAALLHYFLLASFAWMCMEGIQLYIMLVEVFESGKSRILLYYLAGYGVPAVIVSISAAVYHQGYGTASYCWLTVERGFIWAFLAPVIVVLVVNTVMLGIAIRAMHQHAKISATWKMKEKTKLEQLRSWVRGATVLVVLLGLTWTFGLFYINVQTVVFAYIFVLFNSLQGLFIFIFHCLLNDKVKQEYRRCIRHSSWLPEDFKAKYGGSKKSTTISPNQSTNSGGNYFTRLLDSRRRKRSSTSTSLSKTSSANKKRLSTETGQLMPDRQHASHVSDSGIEDPNSYMEPHNIRLAESEFIEDDNDMSLMEGSVADTDYIDRMTSRPSQKPASTNSGQPNQNQARSKFSPVKEEDPEPEVSVTVLQSSPKNRFASYRKEVPDKNVSVTKSESGSGSSNRSTARLSDSGYGQNTSPEVSSKKDAPKTLQSTDIVDMTSAAESHVPEVRKLGVSGETDHRPTSSEC